jgi:hypothetical protein
MGTTSIRMSATEPPPSGLRGAAVIAGILYNQKRLIESGIVYNRFQFAG